MEKRIFLFIGVLLLIIVGSSWLSSKDATPQDSAAEQKKIPPGNNSTAPTLNPSQTSTSPKQAQKQFERQTLSVSFPDHTISWSNQHAGVTSFVLNNPQYREKNPKRLSQTKEGIKVITLTGEQPIDVIANDQGSLDVYLPDSDLDIKDAENNWKLSAVEAGSSCVKTGPASMQQVICPKDAVFKVSYEYTNSQLSILKQFTITSNHQVGLDVSIKNLQPQPLNYHFGYKIRGFQPSQEKKSWFDPTPPATEILWNKTSVQRTKFEKASGLSESDKVGDIRWVGLGPQYFLQAFVMQSGEKTGNKKIVINTEERGDIELGVEYPKNTLAMGQTSHYRVVMYGGPKSSALMEQVKIDDVGVDLEQSPNYTLGFLARPLLVVLIKVNQWVKNWALTIVILTILLKLLTLYPSYRGAKSMKAVSDLKPEIDALQEKYKDNKERLQQEMLQLYRNRGVSQFGGCLPMLLPMPIYFAFYSMLQSAVELYRIPFLWVKDMTATDPYFILPLLTGLIMHLQARFTPSTGDAQQKAISSFVMPMVFLFFGAFYIPAGLIFYILINTLLGVIQQVVTNKIQPKTNHKEPTKGAKKA